MKKAAFALLGLAVILVASLFLPAKRSVNIVDTKLAGLTEYGELMAELQDQIPEGAIPGNLYIFETDRLVGPDSLTAAIPCIRSTPRNVGTAGSADWTFTLEVVSAGRKPVTAEDVKLQVTADPNTLLENDDNVFSPELEQEGTLWTASVSAATLDSAVSPNAEAAAEVLWTFTLSPEGRKTGTGVALTDKAPYISNVT